MIMLIAEKQKRTTKRPRIETYEEINGIKCHKAFSYKFEYESTMKRHVMVGELKK